MIRAAILAISIFSISGAAEAESPTYEQTVQYIKDFLDYPLTKINVDLSYPDSKRSSFKEVSRCTFKFESYTSSKGRWQKVTDTVVMKDIDPGNISVDFFPQKMGWSGHFKIYMVTLRGKRVIHFTDERHDGYRHSGMGKSLGFSGVTSDPKYYGPKVVRALKHLIDLCGGKGELF